MSKRYSPPQKLVDAILKLVVSNYLPTRFKRQKKDLNFTKRDLLFFAKSCGLLSNAFTRERASLPKNYLNNKDFRAAYILYFTVTNYIKAIFCLKETGISKDTQQLDILDIGTGPGTALLASMDFFKNCNDLRLTGIDQNRHIIKDARKLLDIFGNKPSKLSLFSQNIVSKHISSKTQKSFDIVFISNILSEIKNDEEKFLILENMFKHTLKDNGALIIIEPALQKTTRALMDLRDRFLEIHKDNSTIVSPCLHNEPCPMKIANNRDWCHMYLDWTAPHFIKAIDNLIGNKKNYLKFSYLIIKKTAKKDKISKDIFRVVSSPLKSRGKTELLICNRKGLIRLRRLDRDINENNKILDNVDRGELIEHNGKSGASQSINKIAHIIRKA